MDGDGAACEMDCSLTLWLSKRPFFGCFGAVYVKDVLPSCDDFPIPNNDASLELQHFNGNHTAANMCRFSSQRMADCKTTFSHLGPGVKSSSSSRRNMLRYVYISEIKIQPTYELLTTTVHTHFITPRPYFYQSADC